MINLGGSDLIILCIIIGGMFGYISRDKERKKWIGIVLGAIGATVTAFIFSGLLHTGKLFVPIYAILGAWFFLFVFKKTTR